jgi:hypothetical protein
MATTLVVRHAEDKLPIVSKLVGAFLSSNFKVEFQVDKAASVPELSSPQAKYVNSICLYLFVGS